MAGFGSHDEQGALAEINITPLVDVMLVLLIIFMVTAPMLTRSVDVDLPTATSAAPATGELLVVTIDGEGQLYLGERQLRLDELTDTLGAIAAERPDGEVFVRADRRVPYGRVLQVLDVVKAVGLDRLGLVAEPADASESP